MRKKKKQTSYGKTKNGYPILHTYTDRYGDKYIVAKRENRGNNLKPDYLVGSFYDKKSKTWVQGHYDFKTEKSAQKFAKGMANKYPRYRKSYTKRGKK